MRVSRSEDVDSTLSWPAEVAHQLTASVDAGPVGLWGTRSVVHKSTGLAAKRF
jgi:hypothetical protein